MGNPFSAELNGTHQQSSVIPMTPTIPPALGFKSDQFFQMHHSNVILTTIKLRGIPCQKDHAWCRPIIKVMQS